MRILYLTDRLSVFGGADKHLRQVMADAVAAGDSVTLAYGRSHGDALPPAGVSAVRVKLLGSQVAQSGELGRVDALIAASDLIHVQNVMNPTALAHIVQARRVVATVQDHRVFCPSIGRTLPDGSRCESAMADDVCRDCLPDDDYRDRLIELTAARRDALRGAARLIVLSAYMAGELADAGLAGATIVPPWVEVAELPRDGGGSFLLGGRLVPHKGVLDAVAAWRLSGRRLPLRVAGDGPLRAQLTEADTLGWLSAPALEREIRAARGLLFPSRWQEPFGILGVEALAQGRPVVVAQSGGTADWSAAGCLQVAAGDVSAMADAIATLAESPELARELGAQGRAAVAERFDRAKIRGKLREVYDQAASS